MASATKSSLNSFDILVAKCGKTIGLKGEVRLIIYTDFLEIFTKNNVFKCGDLFLNLESFNTNKNIAKFAEINDMDSAKALNSCLLYTSRELSEKYCKLKKDEFFWYEIIGMRVLDGEITLGVVENIERIGSVDYLSIKVDSKIHSRFKHIKAKRFLLPYIARYIDEADINSRQIKAIDALGILEES